MKNRVLLYFRKFISTSIIVGIIFFSLILATVLLKKEVNMYHLVILVVFSITFFSLHSIIKNILQFVLFLVTILYGFISYYYIAKPSYTFLNSIYSAIRLFTFNVDPLSPKSTIYPLTIEIARWSAVLFVISAILTNMYRLTYGKLKLLTSYIIGGHYIICGNTSTSLILAEDLIKKKKRVVMIGPKLQEIPNKNILYIIGSPASISVLKKAGIKSCSHLILMQENDTYNIDILINAKELITKEKWRLPWWKSIKCLVHLVEEKFESVIEDIEDDIISSGTLSSRLEIRVFNTYQASAKLLFQKHPLYKGREKEISSPTANPIHLVIIGFGKAGQNILVQAAKIGHFPNGKKLEVTIIDKRASKKLDQFKRRYRNIDKICNLNQSITLDIDSTETIDRMRELNRQHPISYITISLTDDHLDFVNGMLLFEELKNEEFKDIQIMVQMRNEIKLAKWINEDMNKYKNIFRFGNKESVASSDIIIGENLDKIAKEINNKYIKKNGKGNAWNRLSLFYRASNRAQADHIDTKLTIFNLYKKLASEVSKEDTVLNKEEFNNMVLHSEQFENVAMAEHNRWCAFHYLNGWNTKQPNPDEERDDPQKKQHACLVPYEELDKLGTIYKRDFKENDRNVISEMFDILVENKYVICKTRSNEMPIKYNNHFQQIQDLYQSQPNKIVFFVGAGLSLPLFPSWESLLQELFEKMLR